jgi:hypothetical protein
MLQTFCHAPGFDETHQVPDRAGWSLQPSVSSSSPIATKLRTVWDALREGIAAHRQYEHLRSMRVPHDTAIKQALGISHPGAQTKRSPGCRAHKNGSSAANTLNIITGA